MKDRAFFFGSYEGYRLDAGMNFVEAVPSAAAWARAVPAIAALRPGFLAPGAVILPGASTNPDFDIAQLQTPQNVKENAFSAPLRLQADAATGRPTCACSTTRAPATQPDRASPAASCTSTANPTNAVFNLQGLLGDRHDQRVQVRLQRGADAASSASRRRSTASTSAASLINLSGSVANTGIAGQGATLGHRRAGRPGPRQQRAATAAAQPYDPYSLTFTDSLSSRARQPLPEGRRRSRASIRMATDQLGGITYTLHEPERVPRQHSRRPIQYLGDLSEPSPFNNGATGPRHIEQEYYVGYAQDEWHAQPEAHAELRPALRLLHAAAAKRDNLHRQVQHRHRRDRSEHDAVLQVDEEQLPAARRRRRTRRRQDGAARRLRHLRRPGPDRRSDPADREPSASARRSSGAALVYPIDPDVRSPNFINNPNNRIVPAARLRERVHDSGAGLPVHRRRCSRSCGRNMAATAAYVGSQGRNLFLRSIANRIVEVVHQSRTRPAPRSSFASSRSSHARRGRQRRPASRIRTPRSTTRPAAATTATTRCSSALTRRVGERPVAERAVHARHQQGQHRRLERSADRRQQRAQTLADFDYDNGYNNFDVRHTFNLSALYPLPYGRGRAHVATGVADACRRLGRRRHRQRAQRPADRRAHHAPRHRLRRCRRATCSTTRRPAGRRSSTRRAAAPRATCGGRTWCPASIRSSRTAACCS